MYNADRSFYHEHETHTPHPTHAGGFINDMVKESFEDEEEAMFLHMDRKPTFTK